MPFGGELLQYLTKTCADKLGFVEFKKNKFSLKIVFGESKLANLDAINEFLHQMGNIVIKI